MDSTPATRIATLRTELATLKIKNLKARARECGVDQEDLDDADDAADVRQAIIELIVQHQPTAGQAASALDGPALDELPKRKSAILQTSTTTIRVR